VRSSLIVSGVETIDHVKNRQFLAAIYESTSNAERLLQEDPNFLHYRSIAGETPFHYLIVESDTERAAKLLEWGANINTQDEFGATPLIHAVMLGQLDLVKWLVERGASLDPKNVNGETALAVATSNENAGIFQFLISMPRTHPIDYYYDDLRAQEIYDNGELVMRAHLINLGLTERY
jgi:ankyrin repeat protein